MAIHRAFFTGLAFTLPCLLTACGGGGGGSDSTSSTPPVVPTAECFADYDGQQESWDAFRSSKGHAVYSGNNGRSLSSLNLASGDIALISDVLPFGSRPQLSSLGRYIVLPIGSFTSPVYDQEEGRVRNELELVTLGSGEVSWAPDDSALLAKFAMGSQIKSDLSSSNVDYLGSYAHVGPLAWSPDGDLLATVDDENLVIYELSPIRVVRTIPLEPGSPPPRNLSIDPTSKYLAYTTSHVPEGADSYQRNVYILNLETFESSTIYSTEDVGGLSPDYAWSPSGKFIALVGYDDENDFSLQMYSVDSRSTRRIEGADSKLQEFQWAPASDDLLFRRYNRGSDTYSLHLVVDAESAKSRQVSGPGLEQIQSIEWSPDSRYFTYATWDQSDDNRLYAGDAEAGCVREVELMASATSGPYPGATWSPSGQYLLYRSGDGQDVEHVVIRPDGSGRVSLTPLVAPSGSAGRIEDAQWTRASDTVYLKKSGAEGQLNGSINFVEIDSLGKTTVEANGVFAFAERVYLTE